MNYELVYLMSGAAHCPYLLTSLLTLRRHYDGPVIVHAWPESYGLVSTMAEDARLAISVVEREPQYRGKNAQFLDKILLMQTPGPAIRIYLDADTTVHSSQAIQRLRLCCEVPGFCGTQFNHWQASGGVIKARLDRLRGKPPIEESLIDEVLRPAGRHPSVNGGVFAARPSSPVLPVWHEWSMAAVDVFICDEAVLHLMPLKFPHELYVYPGGSLNASHKYFKPTEQAAAPMIYHGHGNSFSRPDKSPKAVAHWVALFREAYEMNLGVVQSWENIDCGNKYIRSLMRTEHWQLPTTTS